ncbi:MAG: pimeloyl-ACP methyl ester carboxylesterase [Pseudohongiellaceae bacterium]|jgi:pimeloyl-ACP methyl ester carboxylesterase
MYIVNKHISTPIQANECVILLHGLARSSRSMAKLETALKRKGFITVNSNYPSTKHDIETLADEAINHALSQCPEGSKVNFVTHSMGGILVRQFFSKQRIKNLGSVVMLGPPNKGSQVVDRLTNLPGFKTVNGPAGTQLGTSEMSVPNKLGAVNYEVGIIAGTRSINLILSTMLPKPNDGKVSVENTKLIGMTDHITLPVMHPFMMNNNAVISQVLHFLECGMFNR